MSNNQPVDFRALEHKALDMTDDQLRGAIADIRATLSRADQIDRENHGVSYGGKLRDHASVYHAELRRRGIPME